MICKKCGKEFEGNFCSYCGTKVEETQQDLTRCPNCGTPRIGNGRFCVNCGFDFRVSTQSSNVKDRKFKPNNGNDRSNKFLKVFAKIYRWLIASGMIFIGFVSLLCLTAPVITESLFDEKIPLCTGFEAIGGSSDAPSLIVSSSVTLLVLSILCLIYGGALLYFAFKKPYMGVKKYVLWGIDGAISIILIVLGGVVAGEANSENYLNGQLGSGFTMCIVIGVLGILCLGARIFYELKVFKWEDTGLNDIDIRNKGRKSTDKSKAKKIAKVVGIPLFVVAILAAIIVPSVLHFTNIFRADKVGKINLGDSRKQVIQVLGEPYEKSDYRYEYYSDNYIKLAEKIKDKLGFDKFDTNTSKDDDFFGELGQITKLEEQLMNLKYQYIRVEFDSDGKVTSVFLDTEKCESKEYKKVVKSYNVQGNTTVTEYDILNISYSVKYDDGSLFKGTAINIVYTYNENKEIEWTDKYSNKFKTKIEVKPITTLTSDIVTAMAGGDKSLLTEIEISPNLRSIESGAFKGCYNLSKITMPTWAIDFIPESNLRTLETVIISDGTEITSYAFSGCANLTSIYIPISVTDLSYNVFSGCDSLTIYCEVGNKPSGWHRDWNPDKRPAVWGYNNITTNSDFDYVVHNDKIYLTKYKGNETKVVIPAEIENKEVASIGSAFDSNEDLISIEMPSGVTSIDRYAFYGCSSLTSIVIPSGVTSIGEGAFYECESLTNVTFGDDSKLASIGEDAFYGCSSLTSIEIQSGVKSIGRYAFYGCSSLTSIVIPSSVTSVGYDAFEGCSGLTIYCEAESQPSGWDWNWNPDNRPVVWNCQEHGVTNEGIKWGLTKDGIMTIAVYSGTSTQVIIPSTINGHNVTSIGSYAFYNCSNLTSIEMPSGVTSIGEYAFRGCSGLTSIVIPSSVTSIGGRAFLGCSSLTSIEIPSGVTSIGERTFYECESLTSVTFGDDSKLTSIDRYAFEGCIGLTSIVIPSGVTSIGNFAFRGCSNLTSIVIPSSVTSIGSYAFYDCSKLTSIVIPSSVTSVGYDAFGGCYSLTIYCEASSKPSEWAYIGNQVVWGYNNITTSSDFDYVVHNDKIYLTKFKGAATDVIIPKSIDDKEVVSIGEIFRDNLDVTSVTIPSSVTSIGSYAFYDCSKLTSIEIQSGVKSIGDYAFYLCSSLKSIEIPSSVASIGSSAFYGCNNLTSITLPFVGERNNGTNNTHFGYIFGADSYSENNSYVPKDLKEVIITDCSSIDSYAFYNCSSLTSIEIPSSATSVGAYAFYNCSSLTSIDIPSSVTSIGEDAFEGCIDLTIHCEASSKPIGWAYEWEYIESQVEWGYNNITTNSDFDYVVHNDKIYLTKFKGAAIEVIIPKSIDDKEVVSIGEIFRNNLDVTSVTIPSSVTSIDGSAFSGCYSLTKVVWEGHSDYDPFAGLDDASRPDPDDSNLGLRIADIIMQCWQIFVIFISIPFTVANLAVGMNYAKKCKQIKKSKDEYSNNYAIAGTGLFGIPTSTWTVLALIFVGISVLSFIFMITQIARFNITKTAFKDAKEKFDQERINTANDEEIPGEEKTDEEKIEEERAEDGLNIEIDDYHIEENDV